MLIVKDFYLLRPGPLLRPFLLLFFFFFLFFSPLQLDDVGHIWDETEMMLFVLPAEMVYDHFWTGSLPRVA